MEPEELPKVSLHLTLQPTEQQPTVTDIGNTCEVKYGQWKVRCSMCACAGCSSA